MSISIPHSSRCPFSCCTPPQTVSGIGGRDTIYPHHDIVVSSLSLKIRSAEPLFQEDTDAFDVYLNIVWISSLDSSGVGPEYGTSTLSMGTLCRLL